MRHRHKGNKLNRGASHRKATIQNLLKSLVEYELVQTTDARAKELRRHADRLITAAKEGTRKAFRQVQSKLGGDRDLAHKVCNDLVDRAPIADRDSGYVRLIKVGNRQGDNAEISRISWVGSNLANTEELRFPDHILELIETDEVVEDADEEVDEE